MRKLRLLSITAVVAGLVLGMGALSLGGGAQAQESPAALVDALIEAWNAEDAETFVSMFTEEGFAAEFPDATGDPVEYIADEMAAIGPIADVELSNLKISGGAFTGNVLITFEAGFSFYELWTFTEADGEWKVSDAEPASRPVPPGVPAVPITLDEYSFSYNAAAIQAADGNFAFDATNAGEEEHEIVLFEITTDAPLGDVVDAIAASGEDEQPEGVGAVEFLGFWGPGEGGAAVPSAPLGAGRYGLICFIPAADGTPHAFLGMVSEFEVGGGPVDVPSGSTGGGGGITPPSTGDAGLLDAGSGTTTLLMLGLAIVLIGGGAFGLVRGRMASGA